MDHKYMIFREFKCLIFFFACHFSLACEDRNDVSFDAQDATYDMLLENQDSSIAFDQTSVDIQAGEEMSVDIREAGEGTQDAFIIDQEQDSSTGSRDLDATLSGVDLDALIEGGAFDASFDSSLPSSPPEFAHFDLVVELAAPRQQVWAELISVEHSHSGPRFTRHSYSDTGERLDFWPASTIKMYAATAALVLIHEQGFSIDAIATFSHQLNGVWSEDVSMSFREMIHRTFDCSSNETYTLLLRFAGIDWINENFLVPSNGFLHTSLMRDYVTDDARPWSYNLNENQRIRVEESGRTWTRDHQWTGRSYANERGCVVYNDSGTGNCTSPHDLAEHMRRLIFHSSLPEADRFPIGQEAYTWYRGDLDEAVLNNVSGPSWCGGPAFEGVRAVFPLANFHHKEGLVSEFRGSVHHVQDPVTHLEYIAAIMVNDASERTIRKLSEEIARMVKTPELYVHLDYLSDYVNPISADLVTVSDDSGTLTLMIQPYSEEGADELGWTALVESQTYVTPGTNTHALSSACFSESAQWYIRGHLQTDDGREAWSDLHYVIVDHDQVCTP